jgi:hypothetical protein
MSDEDDADWDFLTIEDLKGVNAQWCKMGLRPI